MGILTYIHQSIDVTHVYGKTVNMHWIVEVQVTVCMCKGLYVAAAAAFAPTVSLLLLPGSAFGGHSLHTFA